MNSDRGDFRFSGLVRQPLYVSCGAVSEQANIRKGRAYRMIRAKAAGCARANFALRANGTHRDGEGASGELYGRSCGARGRLTSGAVRRGRFVAGAGMPPPAARGGDMPGRAENPSDGRKRAAGRICGHRNPARAIGKAVPPDEFSDIRRRRERRRCVPAKPTGQAPRGRFVAGAGMPPAARGGDMPGRAESPSGARKRAAGREHSTAERISGRRNPARAIGKAAPRMNFPTSGEGGREDDASRQSRPDKLRAGGSLPEPECPPPHGAATCRGVPKVRQARERGPRGGSIPRRNASADAAIPHGRSERRRPG